MAADYLLQENGSRLKLEDGSGFLLLESSTLDGGDFGSLSYPYSYLVSDNVSLGEGVFK